MSGTNGILERKAQIFSIQKYNVYDGPGIRTLIFLRVVRLGVSGVQILKD